MTARLHVPLVVLPNGWPAFRAAVAAGTGLGFGLASGLALARGVPLAAWLVTVAAAVLSAYLYGVAVKLLTGGEWTTSFRLMACVFGGTWLVLRVAGIAPLVYLDLLAVGLCANQAAGRLGCLLAGCCHGRPARRGVVYGDAHVAVGFPRHLVGVALVPTQLVEAVAMAGLAVLLAAVTLAAPAPGDTLAAYVCGYALARVVNDFFRGDSTRAWALGLTQAQWSVLAFSALVARLSATEVLPPRAVYQLAPFVLAAVAAGVVLGRRLGLLRRQRWLAGAHVEELAAGLAAIAATPESAPPRVWRTSAGLRLSGSTAERNGAPAHVTFSASGPRLREAEARAVAELLGQLAGRPGPAELVGGASGSFHVVWTPRREAAA